MVKLEAARGDFTSLGGLVIFEELINKLELRKKIFDFLPGRKGRCKQRNFHKFRQMMLGFVAGADCLEDMNKLSDDPGFRALCGKDFYVAGTYGNMLRKFEPWQIRRLNETLATTALKLRRKLFKDDRNFILDIDSTDHRQYGKKMEGVRYSGYKGYNCLDSLQAFDQYGFQYWMEVREGATFTANNASTVIERVFRQVPKNMWRFLRADSGYCNFDVMRACAENNVSFVIAMRANMYEPHIKSVCHWRRAKHVFFRDGRECEIGSTIYIAKRNPRETLRVVMIRALKKNPGMFEDRYDYRAWVTNISEHEMKNEDLILFYRKRGNAENMIRELKNGYDIHHFPCEKLIANKAYGLMAAFAYNLMRMQAWNIEGDIPRFSKLIRFRMVNIAGQVVRKARRVIIRISQHRHKEVESWIKQIKYQFGYG